MLSELQKLCFCGGVQSLRDWRGSALLEGFNHFVIGKVHASHGDLVD
ncbi:hypothetical protein KAT36_01660 [Candidatus Pacearchaeota archaeon]|nr:hypothetical protein [Candidatus Pacearchaeota archaeon]